MKLFLASQLEQTIDILVRVCGLKPSTTPTLYIGTAQNYLVPKPPVEGRGSYESLLKRNFPVTICDLENETEEVLFEKLGHMQLVVVGGGNTYFLLHHMKKSRFTHVIHSFLKKGGIYAGSSAGSCVCSPDIAYVGDQDDPDAAPDLTDTKGLGLIDLDIYPHCIEPWYEAEYSLEYLLKSHKDMKKKIYLRDHQALLVQNDFYKIVS